MSRRTNAPMRTILLTSLMVTTILSGCFGDDEHEPSTIPFEDFAAAFAAPHKELILAGEPSTVAMRLIEPGTGVVPDQEEHQFLFLVYDSDAETPIMDATMTLSAEVEDEEHGVIHFTAPKHARDGIYETHGALTANGTWQLQANATLANGGLYEFFLEIRVGEAPADDEDDADDDGSGNATVPPVTPPPVDDGNETATNETGGNETASNNTTAPPGPAYNQSWTVSFTSSGTAHEATFPVNATSANVTGRIRLTASPRIADFTMAIINPVGETMGTTRVQDTEDIKERFIYIEPAGSTGEWTVRVTGQGIAAGIQIQITVTE